MSNYLNAQEIRDNIQISALLLELKFLPVKKSGKELFYISMLRDSDTDPSFCVNDDKRLWHDWGGGNSSGIKGGNIIDFGIAYWPQKSFHEVLSEIVLLTRNTKYGNVPLSTNKINRPRLAIKLPHYKVEDVKDIGNNPVITAYLQYRGILDAPHDDIKEIYYYVEDEKKERKRYFAAGWQNEVGIWEVRNKYFKGSLGKKAVSFIPGDPQSLVAFEGYLNYKSWQLSNPDATQSILVLNSTSLLQAGISKAKSFSQISTFFDNDKNGRETWLAWSLALPHAADASSIYEGYNDYNALTMAAIIQERINTRNSTEGEFVHRGR